MISSKPACISNDIRDSELKRDLLIHAKSSRHATTHYSQTTRVTPTFLSTDAIATSAPTPHLFKREVVVFDPDHI